MVRNTADDYPEAIKLEMLRRILKAWLNAPPSPAGFGDLPRNGTFKVPEPKK